MQGIKLTSQRRGEVSNVNDTRGTHTRKKTTKTKKGVLGRVVLVVLERVDTKCLHQRG